MKDKKPLNEELLQFVRGESKDSPEAAVKSLKAVVESLRAENPGELSENFNECLRRRMLETSDGENPTGGPDSLPIGAPKAQEALRSAPKTSCGLVVPTTELSEGPPTIRPTFLTRSQTTWRWIMRSSVSRVAASVIFVLAITGAVLWFHGLGATPAFADFLKPILEAKGVTYKMTCEMQGPPAMTITSQMRMLDDARSRQETQMPNGSVTVLIRDMSQNKSLHLEPATKTATLYTYANRPKYKPSKTDFDPLSGFRSLLIDARDKPGIERKPLGEKQIDGRRVVGFHVIADHQDMELWGDPKTGLPVRVEITQGNNSRTKATMTDFAVDVNMDESLFSLEPPHGYTMRRETIDESPRENGEKDLIDAFRDYTKVTGVFPDSLVPIAVSGVFWNKFNVQTMWGNITAMSGYVNEEQRREFEKQILQVMNEFEVVPGKPNEKQNTKMEEVTAKIMLQMLWEDMAPPEWKDDKDNQVNKEKRRKFDELMTKMIKTDGKKEDPKKRRREIKEEIRKNLGDQMLADVKAWETRMEKHAKEQAAKMKKSMMESAKAQEANSRWFMEAQRQIQRGLEFADRLPPDADAHYAGKGVSLDSPNTPIFWYRPTAGVQDHPKDHPKDAKRYRIIYADLTVHEADAPPLKK